ncbi:MAG: DNA/RNA helicase domain-containing protein [Bacillota bacterium]|nr:DNA/RNA helicase domain-containing protein [Bacillota bacterium]
MGRLTKFDFNYLALQELKTNEFGTNWPVVYILENGKEAYVGETTSAVRRMKNHLENGERKQLKTVNLITDYEFNKSVTLDLESKLIEYIAADGKYKLQNSNKGMRNHNYYNRDQYNFRFEEIWNELKSNELAINSLFDIQNSDLFKLSPYKVLTDDQRDIVNEIDKILMQHTDSVSVIKGEPGSGKTILAIYLAKYFVSHEQMPLEKVGIVLPMTSLRSTVKKVFRNVTGLKSNMVYGPSQVVKADHKFDLLIVDEAHRLAQRRNLSSYTYFDKINETLGLYGEDSTQLDWIMKSANHVVLFYDHNQSVKPSDINPNKFQALNANWFSLKTQMRVKAGDAYTEYIENILNNTQSVGIEFENYDFRLFSDVEEMVSAIKALESNYGLCRVVAGYAWEWKTKKDPTTFDIEIGNYKYRWNSVNEDWINSDNAINEIGCIHTIQGYDLNYAAVIIGPELIYRDGRIQFVQENYKDRYGKHTSKSGQEIHQYIINIYKTLMSRGILGTYVYACDEELRMYLSRFIQMK